MNDADLRCQKTRSIPFSRTRGISLHSTRSDPQDQSPVDKTADSTQHAELQISSRVGRWSRRLTLDSVSTEIAAQQHGLPREVEGASPSLSTASPSTLPWPACEDVEREGGFPMMFPDESFFDSRDEYEEHRGQYVEYRELVDEEVGTRGACWMKFRAEPGGGGGIVLWKV